MKPSFKQRLTDDNPLVADGAMGTMLMARGVTINTCFDEINLTHPQLVEEVHRLYIEAGADLIETNTFSANRYRLTEWGLEDRVADINRAGVAAARRAIEASGRDGIYLAGSVGPLGVGVQPYGRTRAEDARAAFAEQIAALAEGGVDVLILETFTDLDEILLALAAAGEAALHLPVVCQMTFAGDDHTLLGYSPAAVAHDLHQAGAAVIGVNCSGGPSQLSRVLQAMRLAEPDAPLSAMPNAGFPQSVGGRTLYPATTTYFADYALTFKAIGTRIIGGCCGTTPEHIAAMRQALDDPTRPLPRVQLKRPEQTDEEVRTAEHPTEMARRLAAGKFVISVEMAPPRSYSLNRLLEAARLLQDAGADVVNVADSPTARMRISPWAVCQQLQTRLGMESVLHFPTRGRNLLRIQGDLLGAYALGVRNVFVCMGDPTKIGDYPEALDNYDIVPSGLIKLIKQRMNAGTDQAGNSIGQPTNFNVGCAVNLGADDVNKEIDVLLKKIEAGADFALGQPVFDPRRAEAFLRRYEEREGQPLQLPILMGVMPLYSLKHATFLNNEVPGIDIPPAILKRIEDAGDSAAQEGVRIAQEMLRNLRDLVRGAYIIPAFGRYDLAAEIIDAVAVSNV